MLLLIRERIALDSLSRAIHGLAVTDWRRYDGRNGSRRFACRHFARREARRLLRAGVCTEAKIVCGGNVIEHLEIDPVANEIRRIFDDREEV